MAINAIRDIGYEIALNKMPRLFNREARTLIIIFFRSLGPLVFVFTGSGNVSQGAQELFEHLPHEFVDVATLPKVAQKGSKIQIACLNCLNFRFKQSIWLRGN